jgi:hypothetical protein
MRVLSWYNPRMMEDTQETEAYTWSRTFLNQVGLYWRQCLTHFIFHSGETKVTKREWPQRREEREFEGVAQVRQPVDPVGNFSDHLFHFRLSFTRVLVFSQRTRFNQIPIYKVRLRWGLLSILSPLSTALSPRSTNRNHASYSRKASWTHGAPLPSL